MATGKIDVNVSFLHTLKSYKLIKQWLNYFLNSLFIKRVFFLNLLNRERNKIVITLIRKKMNIASKSTVCGLPALELRKLLLSIKSLSFDFMIISKELNGYCQKAKVIIGKLLISARLEKDGADKEKVQRVLSVHSVYGDILKVTHHKVVDQKTS